MGPDGDAQLPAPQYVGTVLRESIHLPTPHEGCMVLDKGPAGPKPHKVVWCWMGGLQLPECHKGYMVQEGWRGAAAP